MSVSKGNQYYANKDIHGRERKFVTAEELKLKYFQSYDQSQTYKSKYVRYRQKDFRVAGKQLNNKGIDQALTSKILNQLLTPFANCMQIKKGFQRKSAETLYCFVTPLGLVF